MPLKHCDHGPYLSRIGDEVVDLSGLLGDDIVEARDHVAAATGQRGSSGATRLNGVRSAGWSSQVVDHREAVEPASGVRHLQRQTRGPICCCTATLRDSSPTDGRPSPSGGRDRSCWSGRSGRSRVFEITPQASPPLARRSWAAGFEQVAIGHEIAGWHRSMPVSPPLVPNTGVVCGMRSVGVRAARRCPSTPAPSRYSPRLTLSTVLPLPTRSYAAPDPRR